MKISGTDFPNLNDGYKTTVMMDFEITRLGNNKIALRDYGSTYDKYQCKGSVFLDKTEVDALYDIYNDTGRGQVLTLTDCVETGFYPFTIAVDENSYDIILDEPKNRGMVDDAGKIFQVDLTFMWKFPLLGGVNNIQWNNPVPYCKEGNLEFASYTEIRFPKDGFDPKKGHDVYNQNNRGAVFYGVNFPTKDSEWNETEFSLNLRGDIASNLIYRILNTYRSNDIFIKGADNYFIFGADQGDNTQYTVKMNTGEVEIKHVEHEDFEIEFNLVKI